MLSVSSLKNLCLAQNDTSLHTYRVQSHWSLSIPLTGIYLEEIIGHGKLQEVHQNMLTKQMCRSVQEQGTS